MPTLGGSRGGPAQGGGGATVVNRSEIFRISSELDPAAQFFDLQYAFQPINGLVVLNGVILHQGPDLEYQVVSAKRVQILETVPLKSGDELQFLYTEASSGIIFQRSVFVVTEPMDVDKQIFELEHASAIYSEIVSLNGIALTYGFDCDYVFSGPGRVKISSTIPLKINDKIQVKYQAL